MRASRLLTIQMLLQTRGRLSAADLAKALEVSVRTLHRDIDELTAAGVPVYAERGRAGGFQLLPGWSTSLTGFTPDEAQAVFLSGLPGPAADLGMAPKLRDAELKLLSALPEAWRGPARNIRERLHLDPVDWYREVAPPVHLQVISDAVWRGRQLAIRYASWERTADRVVHPLGLVLKAGTWYLVAARSGEPRTYRIDQVESAQVIDEACARPKDFDLAAHWRDSVARFERDLLAGHADVAATSRGLVRLRQQSAALAKVLRAVAPPLPGERVTLRIPVEADEQASAQLLQLAPDVEVLGPRALRDAVLARLQAAAQCYGAAAPRSRKAR